MYFDKETEEMEDTEAFDERKLQKIEEYVKNPDACSLFIPVNIEEIFQKALATPELLPRVQDIVDKMARHPDCTMRKFTVKKLPRLALLCLVEEMPHYVTTRLCPILLPSLNDENEEVRKAGEVALVVLIRGALLERKTVEEKVCPWITQVCKTNGYASTVALLGKLAPLIGKEAMEKHFLDVFVNLCSSESYPVRKSCVKSLGDVAVVLGTETGEKYLLNNFVKLCRDDNWEVRACCPEVFIPVSCTCSLNTRKTVLADAFADLLKDPKYSIRMSAYEFLGAFICTFADPSVTKLDYDEKGELILVGQDGYEFRMGPLHSYSRDMQISEESKEQKSFSNEGKGDQALMVSKALRYFVQNEPGQLNLSGVNESQNYLEMTDQPSSNFSWTTTKEQSWWNKSWNSMEDQDGVDDMYNEFRFWRTPFCELDAIECEPEQDEIRTNLKILDNELSYLSEKLAECSTVDLEENKTESLISCASSSDSGWNSAETTPHVESLLPLSNEKASTSAGSEIQSCSNDDSPVPASCCQEVVPQILLDTFLSMASLHLEMPGRELALECAYCLPAVALTLGPSNWPFIKNAYKCLSMDIQWRVRKTVVSGIHKLALLVGEDIASKDLAPIFEGFIRDLDEVKIGALEHLADFLELVRPATRNAFLPRLQDFLATEIDFNWRYREEFGEQLRLLIKLYHPPDWLEYFKPLAILLLCDKVAAVRQKAVSLFLELIVNLSCASEYREKLLNVLLDEFAGHSSWRRRQIFVHVCSEIARQKALDENEFRRFLLEPLLELSTDSVPNVGLSVARCLAIDIVSTDYLDSSSPHSKRVLETLEKLKCNVDPDIRYFACQTTQQVEKNREEEKEESEREQGAEEKKTEENKRSTKRDAANEKGVVEQMEKIKAA